VGQTTAANQPAVPAPTSSAVPISAPRPGGS
jgi:hypothetical protein